MTHSDLFMLDSFSSPANVHIMRAWQPFVDWSPIRNTWQLFSNICFSRDLDVTIVLHFDDSCVIIV